MRFPLPLLLICLLVSTAAAQNGSAPKSPYEEAFGRLEYRSIGPAIMGGRIADVEGVPGDANVVYVASASGGLWKTTNGGVTWKPIFERQGTLSLGDIALAPSNPEVVWVGTGESNVRNSVSFGDGVYKSTDGGKTWQHMGLKDTERISAIVINPQNPDIVYIGALGHAFGPNEERGVFMTTDGGKTWAKTLYIDNQHGVADLEIDPTNPNILYAGMWSFERKPWTHRSGSEKGGVYKSIDGGRTFRSITGRTHIDYHALWLDPKNPKRMWHGQDGGVAVTYDGGESWEAVYNIPLGQFYQVHADNHQPFYNVMGGLQDNGSWTGPSRTREPSGIQNDDWRMVSFGDGFYVINNPDNPDQYLSESQGANMVWTDMTTREQQ